MCLLSQIFQNISQYGLLNRSLDKKKCESEGVNRGYNARQPYGASHHSRRFSDWWSLLHRYSLRYVRLFRASMRHEFIFMDYSTILYIITAVVEL